MAEYRQNNADPNYIRAISTSWEKCHWCQRPTVQKRLRSRDGSQREAAALLFPNIPDIALPVLSFFCNIYTLWIQSRQIMALFCPFLICLKTEMPMWLSQPWAMRIIIFLRLYRRSRMKYQTPFVFCLLNFCILAHLTAGRRKKNWSHLIPDPDPVSLVRAIIAWSSGGPPTLIYISLISYLLSKTYFIQ